MNAEPEEYRRVYGDTLRQSSDLPDFVNDFVTPPEMADNVNKGTGYAHELEGDLFALSMIDLRKEGLEEYSGLFLDGVDDYTSNYLEVPLDDEISFHLN